MIDLITNNLEAIREACKQHHVKELYLFGSAASGEFNSNSDFDFLYSFKNNEVSELAYADNFFDFKYNLEALLKREVDLIEYKEFRNPYFKKTVEGSKKLIYAS